VRDVEAVADQENGRLWAYWISQAEST